MYADIDRGAQPRVCVNLCSTQRENPFLRYSYWDLSGFDLLDYVFHTVSLVTSQGYQASDPGAFVLVPAERGNDTIFESMF